MKYRGLVGLSTKLLPTTPRFSWPTITSAGRVRRTATGRRVHRTSCPAPPAHPRAQTFGQLAVWVTVVKVAGLELGFPLLS